MNNEVPDWKYDRTEIRVEATDNAVYSVTFLPPIKVGGQLVSRLCDPNPSNLRNRMAEYLSDPKTELTSQSKCIYHNYGSPDFLFPNEVNAFLNG